MLFGADHYRFRWVECQLEVLRDCLTMTSVEAALSDLPETLDETYDRILKRIDKHHFKYARTAFALLIVTCRPLKVEELAEAVVVAPYCKAMDIDDRLFDLKDIIKICGGLVIRVADTNEARFAHYSVQEYLLSSRISYGSAAFFALSRAAAEQKIAEVCLTYLLSFDQPDSMYRDVMVDYPFLDYSMYHWHDHIHLHGHGNSASLSSLCATFFDAERNHACANWISMLDYEVYYDIDENPPEAVFEQPVNTMMAVGRRDIARTLLLDWRAWHSHGYDCDNILRLAAKTIDRMTLQTLIGSDCDIGDERLAHPNLLRAAASNAEFVSKIIRSQVSGLARRSPILVQYWVCTALEAALNASHQQLVKILLEAGADVHVNGKFQDPVLVIAIQSCNNCDEVLEIVKLLLEHGAEINTQSSTHGTALHVALGSGHSQLARYLLDRGADTNLVGGENGTTLEAAISGSQDLAAEFIKSGADVNTKAGWIGTALQAATCTNNIEIMQLLIRSGADVNLAAPIALHDGENHCHYGSRPFREHWKYNLMWRAMDGLSSSELSFRQQASPINIACQNGSLAAVKLLLDSGVNLKERETGHSAPLRWSIVRSDWTASRREIVRLLIDAGDRLSILENIDKSSAKPPFLDGNNTTPVDRSRLSEADLEHLSEEWHQKLSSAMTDGSETQINDLIDTICSRNPVDLMHYD
jgi:ankyrin repeat protein